MIHSASDSRARKAASMTATYFWSLRSEAKLGAAVSLRALLICFETVMAALEDLSSLGDETLQEARERAVLALLRKMPAGRDLRQMVASRVGEAFPELGDEERARLDGAVTDVVLVLAAEIEQDVRVRIEAEYDQAMEEGGGYAYSPPVTEPDADAP